jgi:hypothetical protein
MTRRIAAAVLTLHGLIHLIGFIVPWRLASVEGMPYTTSGLAGALDLGPIAVRILGLGWLALAVGFVIAGVGILHDRRWALSLTAVLAVWSLALCVLGLPETVAGIVVNVLILGAVTEVETRRRRARAVEPERP